MNLDYVIDRISGNPRFKEAVEHLRRGHSRVNMMGISGSRRAFWIAALEATGYPLLVITNNLLNAREIVEDLNTFTPHAYIYPSHQPLWHDTVARSMESEQARIRVMDELLTGKARIVVAPVDALLFPVMSPERYLKHTFEVETGQVFGMEGLIGRLTASGYEREDMTEGPGRFSVRGGIVDVFPMGHSPCRIEFFGDEVDSIRILDISSQRSVEKVKCVRIPPCRELIMEEGERDVFLKNLEEDLRETEERLGILEASGLSDGLREEVGKVKTCLEARASCTVLNNYWMYGCSAVSVMEYFQRGAVVVIDSPVRVAEGAQSFYREFANHYSGRLEKGKALLKQKNRIYSYQEISSDLDKRQTVAFAEILTGNREMASGTYHNFSLRSMNPFYGKLAPVIEEIERLKSEGFLVSIIVSSRARGDLLQQELKDREIYAVMYPHSNETGFFGGDVVIDTGTIKEGFVFPGGRIAVFSDRDIFGALKRKTVQAKRPRKEGIEIFTELSTGDYVVHENLGIGIYRGIQELKVEGIKRDYMKIEYGGGDVLYLPTYQSHLIQKYVGAEGKRARLSRMGGREWSKTKAGVKKAIENMARELLKLYAAREAVEGHSFRQDTPWQGQFEDLFPYQETPDQLKCIQEIKEDMERCRPMDRLLCGDVGYGKTEVAMRAAFKAVMDGKQVAMLVPTTILAQQHYNTFLERMGQFPVNIEMISRFRTAGQQREILRLLKEGNIDIIIGTHRLLQGDVVYRDLGLLIVDEEQRFGVAHKEVIKELKKEIDVLTLTATPIPRTLHMSMTGIRDMSVILDPPESRIPVETYVVEYNEELIRDAILRELSRDGQVYFVYNRVKSIDKAARELSRIVPEASICIAHGQMDERELETVMMDFWGKRYDVLLCTTIIENGLDLPNVNTIIVTDADRLGLSQMYQLRGRVGRSDRQAYAYFAFRKDKVLTEAAEKRLKAIKEFTQFGAGFKIALRDLEIRGAGNILGHEQHGHMMMVGYDLYCKLLNQTVKEIRGLPVEEKTETLLDIKVDAYIPGGYIQDEKQKVEVYRRIAAIESRGDYYDVEEEIEDRFGDLTPPVRNLLVMAYIKALCQKLGITSIEQKENIVTVRFKSADSIKAEVIGRLLSEYSRKIRFEATAVPRFSFKVDTADAYRMLMVVKGVLEKIIYFHQGQIAI